MLNQLDFREAYKRDNALILLECLLGTLPQASAGGSFGGPRRSFVEVLARQLTQETYCRR